MCRPKYSAVAPLRDDEDREIALGRIVSLTEELSYTARLIASIDNNELSPLVSSALAAIDHHHPQPPPLGDSSQPPPPPPHLVGSVHSAYLRLAYHASEAAAIQLNASVVACRLWALRQAVAIYDASRGSTPILPLSAPASVPAASACAASAGGGGCYRCGLAAIGFATEVLLHTGPRASDVGEPVLTRFLDVSIPALRSLSRVVRSRLRELVVLSTRDSLPLVRQQHILLVE